MVNREDLLVELDEILQPDRFDDYGPNGLQVEGRPTILRLVTGVTASLALIDRAIALRADAILVHHGWFWRGEDARVVGQKARRLRALMGADINLLAYHLPLDAHPLYGNNATLAAHMGWTVDGRFGRQDLGMTGQAPACRTLGDLARALKDGLRRAPVLVGDPGAPVGRLAWCTGAAQDWISQAGAAGANTYVSGEISEPTAHYAREMGVAYLACGHHATERYGVRALGTHLAQRFDLEHHFIDLDNPA